MARVRPRTRPPGQEPARAPAISRLQPTTCGRQGRAAGSPTRSAGDGASGRGAAPGPRPRALAQAHRRLTRPSPPAGPGQLRPPRPAAGHSAGRAAEVAGGEGVRGRCAGRGCARSHDRRWRSAAACAPALITAPPPLRPQWPGAQVLRQLPLPLHERHAPPGPRLLAVQGARLPPPRGPAPFAPRLGTNAARGAFS